MREIAQHSFMLIRIIQEWGWGVEMKERQLLEP